MYRIFFLAASLLFAAPSSAGNCNVPVFEKFEPTKGSQNLSLQVDMQPIAQLKIPTGFSKIGALPEGSIGFGQHPSGMSALLGFETKTTLSVHTNGVKPALFFLSVFNGAGSDGCRYLQSYQLKSEDYRLKANLEKGAELFAFGKGNRHQFYLIRRDKPDFVLRGLFKNLNRVEFESILSTLTID